MQSLLTAITVISLACGALAQNDCYYAAGKRAGSAIVPCGSSGTISSCCQIGDLCLSDSACWNPTHNVTYLYGCSDSTYTDPSCPWKCGPDYDSSPYVGLVYCYNTTQNEWSCTHPPSNSESIQENAPQQCYDDSIVAFAGPSSLQPILSLPTNVGGSTVYFTQVNPTSYSLDPNYSPTTSIRPTASIPTGVVLVSPTPIIINTDASSSTNSQSSNANSASNSSPTLGEQAGSANSSSTSSATGSNGSSGLSTGAKAGIGVGVGIGVGALGVVAGIILFRHRKSHAPVPQREEYLGPAVPDMKESRSRPLSELEGSTMGAFKYAQSGHGHSSTLSMQDGSALTNTTDEPTPFRPAGRDRLHEMG